MEGRIIATANLSDKGYIELIFLQEDVTLDVEEVSYGWKLATEISPEKNIPVLLMTGKWSLITKDSRDYLSEELDKWPSVAIVVNNMGQRLMGQIVISITGKSERIKIFDNEEKARAWIEAKVS